MNNCENCANHNSKACQDCLTAYVGGVRQDPSQWKPFPITNADHIRAMSDEDLCQLVMAIIRVDICPMSCQCSACVFRSICTEDDDRKKVIEWLQKPAEVE